MKRLMCTFFFVGLVFTAVYGQRPDWTQQHGKSIKYPGAQYYIGYGVAHQGKTDDPEQQKQLALDAARKNLIEKIQVRISSDSRSYFEETKADYSDFYSSTTLSSSSLEIWGLDSDTYYDQIGKRWHALVTTRKDRLLETYRKKAGQTITEIDEHLAAARSQEAAGEPTAALAEYLLCYPLLDDIQATQTLISIIKAGSMRARFDRDAEEPGTKITRGTIREAVNRLIQRPINSTDDLAWSLAYQLDNLLDKPDGAVMTTPFTFQDTRMGSPFARYFQPVLDRQLAIMTSWVITPQTAQFGTGGQRYVLAGTYWEQPSGIKLMAELRRVPDGTIVASADAMVAVSVLQATNMDLKPQNFSIAFSDQKHFRTGEVVGDGLMLDVWTNKGNENLLYTEGEIMTVYLRVNVPCYVRFIYHLADSSRTLLMDSHYIDETKVNLVYQIPNEFECAEPFGAEWLQVFARTEEFEPVETVLRDGYYFLKEDLPVFLARTRGFKERQPEAMQAERRIVITTMGR